MAIEIAAVLSFIALKMVNAIATRASGALLDTFNRDEAEKVFRGALASAIRRYAEHGERAYLAKPLLRRRANPLRDEAVADELAKIVHFDLRPDPNVIADRWRASFDTAPSNWDFIAEAEILTGYVENELRSTEMFRGAFEHRSIEAIAVDARATAESLEEVEDALLSLTELLDARLGLLLEAFASAQPAVRDRVRDFTGLIEEKTNGFVGRGYVLDAIDRFIADSARGYCIIEGDPGMGKSAIAAQFTKAGGYVHHFNVRAAGINTAAAFLENVCAQLIIAHGLSYSELPPHTSTDGGVLAKLLADAADGALQDDGRPVVIVVDALDEVDPSGQGAGSNLLYLPALLPDGVYVIVTTRRLATSQMSLRIDCEQTTIDVVQDAEHNLETIRLYLEKAVSHPAVTTYADKQGLGPAGLVEQLVVKSQGNFMYLRYIVPEIARGSYDDLHFDDLPVGLEEYYADHWRRMRQADDESWFEFKLPVVMALSQVRETVPIDVLMEFSGVRQRSRVRGVLNEWKQFLFEEPARSNGVPETHYRIYHDTFRAFVESIEEVEDERVSRAETNERIAEVLWQKRFGQSPEDWVRTQLDPGD